MTWPSEVSLKLDYSDSKPNRISLSQCFPLEQHPYKVKYTIIHYHVSHTYPSLALSNGDWWWCGLERVESSGWCLEGTSLGGGNIPGEGPLWLALEPLYMPVNTQHFAKSDKQENNQVSPGESPTPSLFPHLTPRHKHSSPHRVGESSAWCPSMSVKPAVLGTALKVVSRHFDMCLSSSPQVVHFFLALTADL